MSGREIRVGDKVRYKGEPLWISENIVKDDIATVYEVCSNGNVRLSFPAVGLCSVDDVEFVTPKRTVFLERLGALLEEFDAEITYTEGDCELHIDIGDGNKFDRISYMFEYPGYDYGDGGYLKLTADNIMDFEKE